MTIKCAWASIDERGKAKGGKAGDQTGKEVKIGNWYNFSQNVILRPTTKTAANKMVAAAKWLAKSNLVGYDQGQRETLYNALKKVDFKYSKLKTKCETDCSAFIACLVNIAGIKVSPSVWTGNMKSALLATKKFTALTAKKYLTSGDYLKAGDIILNEKSHVIIAIENGSKLTTTSTTTKSPTSKSTAKTETKNKYYKVIAKKGLNLRNGPGLNYSIILAMPYNASVEMFDKKGKWYKVNYKGHAGYCDSTYLK